MDLSPLPFTSHLYKIGVDSHASISFLTPSIYLHLAPSRLFKQFLHGWGREPGTNKISTVPLHTRLPETSGRQKTFSHRFSYVASRDQNYKVLLNGAFFFSCPPRCIAESSRQSSPMFKASLGGPSYPNVHSPSSQDHKQGLVTYTQLRHHLLRSWGIFFNSANICLFCATPRGQHVIEHTL